VIITGDEIKGRIFTDRDRNEVPFGSQILDDRTQADVAFEFGMMLVQSFSFPADCPIR
jgi:hypothetical protein